MTIHRVVPLLAGAAGLALGLWLARRRPDAIPAAASLALDTELHILHASPAAATLFGTSPARMRGLPLAAFLQPLPDLPDDLAPAYFGDSAGRTGRRATDAAVTGVRANGATFPLAGVIARDAGGALAITLRDLSAHQRTEEKLTHSYEQLRQLSTALQTVREEERTHIARELHDDLGQLLATLRMDLALLQQDASTELIPLLATMERNLLTAIASLRRIATNLRPRALDEGGLYFALQGLRDEFVARHGIACSLYADESELRLDDAASTALFRIVQEALTNIARHAHAANVSLSLYRIDGQLLLSIRDDGCGIAAADFAKTQSLGLIGMRERVWGMQGDIAITADEPAGTRIDITLPMSFLKGGFI